MYFLRRKGESEELNEIDFEKNLYKDKNYVKLYKYKEDLENIKLTISQLNICAKSLRKKLNICNDKKVVNFVYDYDYEIKKGNIENTNTENHLPNKGYLKKINSFYKNFINSNQISKRTKSVRKECKKIEFLLRNICKNLDKHLFFIEKDDNLDDIKKKFNNCSLYEINTNQIINIVKEIELIKNNSLFGSMNDQFGKNFRNEEEKQIFYNFIFNDYEEISLRLLSLLAVFKNFNLENFMFSKENEEFALNLCKNIIHDNKLNKNESLIYYAKSFLINYFNDSKQQYFYSDYILEINQSKNFYDFTKLINNKNNTKQNDKIDEYQKANAVQFNSKTLFNVYKNYDYDVIFICGLNANFAKSWRIPDKMNSLYNKDIFDFYMKGKNIDKMFPIKNYQLWIPRMLETKTFKDKNIRYIVSVGETKFFKLEHMMNNIPDLSINELSDRIYKSLKIANVGDKPFILVCHSMGGLIAKNMINIAEENKDKNFLENNKGIVFFSTPHLGSKVITSIISSAVNNYIKFINIFNHTIADHGFENHDLKQKIGEFQFAKACTEICFTEKEVFEKQHEQFRKFNLDYVNFIETDKTFIQIVKDEIHVVEPESAYLPEVKNHILENKKHNDLQKFSPDNMNDKGYVLLCDYIENRLKI